MCFLFSDTTVAKAPLGAHRPAAATNEYVSDTEKPYCSLSDFASEAPVYEPVQYHM